MNVNLGNKIRELRKARNISQEVLAQYLGISFQAVSKWENGTAMPDVALIPALASFFGVSTDELFDYNHLEVESRVMDLCWDAAEYRFSDPARSEAMLREGLKQYPGNDIILNNLLVVLEGDPARSEETITICKTLIEGTKDAEVKYDALRILADTYHRTGQQALVAPTLNQIPELYFTKLEEMAFMLEGEDSLDAAKRHMGLCYDQMLAMLFVMRERYKRKNEDDEAQRCERIANGVIEAFRKEGRDDMWNESLERWLQSILNDLT